MLDTMRSVRLNAIGIICSDLEASLRFYRMCGVDLPAYDPDTGHYEADLGDGIRILLDAEAVIASFDESFTPPTDTGRIGLAVECDSPELVDNAYTILTDAGLHGEREPFDAFWGQRYATINDPDGNPVDLYAALS